MPAERPLFTVPSGAAAKVSIIDSTLRLGGIKFNQMCKSPPGGLHNFPVLPTWSFLIESSNGKKALFDLGVHLDLTRYVPRIQQFIKDDGWTPEAREHVADIIKRHGMDPKEIDSVIWSHYHFDHTGDPTTFPSSTEVVVGPGFKDTYFPGYPTKPESPMTEQDLGGREVREINFAGHNLKAGPFSAYDFFGDGSFYLLDTPGHCLGHMAGLARTSKAEEGSDEGDTFIMMGGDLCHHGGEIRPSPYLPLPDQLPSSVGGGSAAAFRQLNTKRGKSADEPFLEPSPCFDQALSDQTIEWTQIVDADPNVWVIIAHDTALLDGIDLFPEAANNWKKKAYKEKTMWKFLEDLKPAC
ncbi:hypothetical protein M406DRAFT_342602 [Cryphonectria parasitica EP155]|uniref:Metallo-beta-lactamase domain-containing protein n=1 Tax=Cryphonectria parasitica (strain ATCC 38755 / EP155) TaxID=660469 RepID=A0A9P4XVT4_CRYP1|nr:uncharacterized protein M406DRAFT_342602 [Cryphonectria parasitica EP155]KAF3761923.1 hypothetical protein M406DRAFT_342602 [Cryphonectria parasitica EP155]